MPPAPCDGCSACGTALSPAGFYSPVKPHIWEPYWDIDHKTGEKIEKRKCQRCHKLEGSQETVTAAVNESDCEGEAE